MLTPLVGRMVVSTLLVGSTLAHGAEAPRLDPQSNEVIKATTALQLARIPAAVRVTSSGIGTPKPQTSTVNKTNV